MSSILKAFLENRTALKKFLWRFYSRAEDVEDAVQEAFLRSFAAEARKDIELPKQYLFQVAKNYALSDIAKKQNSSTDMLEDFSTSSVLEDGRLALADEQLDQRQKLAAFAEAVALLPPKCRQVFILRKVYGLKVKEIAAQLDISVSSVEKHIAAGLIKCADYLSKRGYKQDVCPRSSGRKAVAEEKSQTRLEGCGDFGRG